ncbi:hypothetical protein Phou_012270 [Phytohabitans houttuyneae]|uniref:Uncharacterized protein n=1 Tax=Phytohabitans houttuyneae TaxID=1076126 RepID=A0A6V8K5M8_9ACTN|nr:hypothetical protein Phou_012270 [Phytohabitans houttuyneae]
MVLAVSNLLKSVAAKLRKRPRRPAAVSISGRTLVYAPNLDGDADPGKSCGPGWRTRTTRGGARTAPCWWWGGTGARCWG